MENQNQNTVQQQVPAAEPIIRPTETVEFLMSPIGQQLKTIEMNQQLARTFSMSTIVPTRFQGASGLANCYIAVDMAMRLGANPLLVMQNLYVVHGNPGWSAKFLIATFNQCGRYTSIRFEYKGQKGQDEWGVRAYAYELTDKDKKSPLYGPWIDIALAKSEGWYNQNPKWKNIPEQMLRYRAAAWFVNTTAPELSMGINTVEEKEDANRPVDAEYEELTQQQTFVNFDDDETLEEKSKESDTLDTESPQAPQESAKTDKPIAKPRESKKTPQTLFG